MKNENFVLTSGSNTRGQHLILSKHWNSEFLRLFDPELVTELSLSTSQGFTGTDVSFIEHFRNVTRLTVLAPVHTGLQSMGSLKDLETLIISPAPQQELDFSQLHSLKNCEIEWWSGATSLFGCSNLQKLRIEKWKAADIGELLGLTNLQSLWLGQSSVVTLAGIGTFAKLQELTLVALNKLGSFSDISECHNLEALSFYRCTKLIDISFLRALRNLKQLSIENCGTVSSLEPITVLEKLVSLTVDGSTSIEDGDIKCLLKCQSLTKLVLKGRQHYNLDRAGFYKHRWPNQDWAKGRS